MTKEIEDAFPRLKSSPAYKPHSPKDPTYNCIAYAADDQQHFWWPDKYWPKKVAAKVNIASFQAAFEKQGYAVTQNATLEAGIEKVAVFARNGAPQHAAKQLSSGVWCSKMGRAEDILHNLNDIEGGIYGDVVLIMARPAHSRRRPVRNRQLRSARNRP